VIIGQFHRQETPLAFISKFCFSDKGRAPLSHPSTKLKINLIFMKLTLLSCGKGWDRPCSPLPTSSTTLTSSFSPLTTTCGTKSTTRASRASRCCSCSPLLSAAAAVEQPRAFFLHSRLCCCCLVVASCVAQIREVIARSGNSARMDPIVENQPITHSFEDNARPR